MLLKLLSFLDIIEIHCYDKIYSGYRTSYSNSPNGSAWKYLKSYTEISTYIRKTPVNLGDAGVILNLTGWPRSGWPQVGHFDQKSKSTKLLHIVLCYTQGVVAYDPVLFWGCIPPPLTPQQVKPEPLILISIGGRTLQCGVMYIFNVLVLPKLTFITYCGIGKSKGL